jgi:hypothetical protein
MYRSYGRDGCAELRRAAKKFTVTSVNYKFAELLLQAE